MTKFLQFLAVFLDLCILCCLLYSLLLIVIVSIEQLCIRTRCKYKGRKEKPGRACVICDDQDQCSRAWQSEEYQKYFFCRFSHPDQAQKLFDEIRAEEETKSKPK